MRKIVVDTNVLIAANRECDHIDRKCELDAALRLDKVLEEEIILLDTYQQVLTEYRTYCNYAGQRGVGDRFFSELIRNIANLDRVVRIDIGRDEQDAAKYIPAGLIEFDRGDWKWIALCLNGLADAIVNATDSDYTEHAAALSDAQIRVEELCPHCLRTSPKGATA